MTLSPLSAQLSSIILINLHRVYLQTISNSFNILLAFSLPYNIWYTLHIFLPKFITHNFQVIFDFFLTTQIFNLVGIHPQLRARGIVAVQIDGRQTLKNVNMMQRHWVVHWYSFYVQVYSICYLNQYFIRGCTDITIFLYLCWERTTYVY